MAGGDGKVGGGNEGDGWSVRKDKGLAVAGEFPLVWEGGALLLTVTGRWRWRGSADEGDGWSLRQDQGLAGQGELPLA